MSAVARIAKPTMRGLHVAEVKRYVVYTLDSTVLFIQYMLDAKPAMRSRHVAEVKRYVVYLQLDCAQYAVCMLEGVP
jgi:hypothetical protein